MTRNWWHEESQAGAALFIHKTYLKFCHYFLEFIPNICNKSDSSKVTFTSCAGPLRFRGKINRERNL